MRIGIVGYGAGGRYFHAPFIEAADGVELAGIVARSDAKRAQAEADFPGLPVYGSLAGLLDAGVDAVTITTPPHTRHDLVMEAIAAGVHVVADKPFAPNAEAARELAEAAARVPAVDSCATWAATWLTRCCGCWDRRATFTQPWTGRTVSASGRTAALWSP